MSLLITPISPGTITQGGTENAVFLGAGRLDVTGTPQRPILVTLSTTAGAGILETINISYADVTLTGAAGANALATYNIGSGGTLRWQSTAGISAATTIDFTGSNSHLVLGSAVDLNVLGGINGFGPGSNIDVAFGPGSYSYSDNSGNGTGGTLTLHDVNGGTKTITLGDGEFTASSFNVHPDGNGGTLIDFATYVSGIAATPATADLTVGGNVALTLTTTAPVSISGGTPTLTLSDGGVAIYDASSSTPTSLVFRHTVQPGQNTADLTVTGVNNNGATVTDVIGNAVTLGGAVGNPAGTLQIDTTPPSITGLSTTPGSGSLAVGQIVTFNVTPNEAVTVRGGTPTLTLNDGGTATYNPGASTPSNLVFTYTVQPGQNAADLAVIAANLNGATIVDGAGNAGGLSGAVGNPAGTLVIDTTPATVGSVSTTPGSGAFRAGQVVAINVSLSEGVTIAGGTPTLTLNDGGTATYDPANSTSTMLAFKYTVQAGDNTADLTVTGTSLNGATMTDGAGNASNLSGAIGNPPGIVQIDTTAPTVAGVTTTPGSGTVTAGQVITISITPSEAVSVTGGTPTLTLNDGGAATYDAADSTPTLLVFKSIVSQGQTASDLTITGASTNGATIADPAGNALNLSGAIGNPPGVLQVNTTLTPVTSVYNVTTLPGDGDLGAGQVVAVMVNLTGSATVSGGPPTLSLNDGGTATYDAATSTPTKLVFRYTAQPGQNTNDLAVTGYSPNGAVVTDSNAQAVDMSGAVANPGGILQIDTTSPTVTGVTTTPGSGALGAGQLVAINVATSEAVTVSGGPPTLTLNDGGVATYDAANSTPTLMRFNYTVQPGQNTADLTVTAANLNGATVADGAGNALNLSSAAGNPAGTLAIDTVAPTVIALATQPSSGALAAGQVATISLTPSEAVSVSGGTPTLTLDDGGIAVYDAANSTPTRMLFTYTVQPGQNTADLTVTAANLNGATVTDSAGNALDLSGATGNPPGVLAVDTTAPTVVAIAAQPGTGALAAGQVATISLTASEPVTVTGTPTLTLNDGGVATYDAANSTATLMLFTYTVQPGQNTADLTVTAANLNDGSVTDRAGNALNLSTAVGNPAGILAVDTVAPTVTSVATQPGTGSLATGQTATIVVTPSEAVTVSGGTPTLMLNDGGTAVYDPANSTPTMMLFTYTVQPGQSTTDLAVTGANLNGASVTDAAGNPLDFSGAVDNPPGTLQVGAAPAVTNVAATPSNADLRAGGNIVLQVSTSAPITVAGGTPTLALNDGGTAVYDAASSTPTLLVFRNTVQAGQNTPDLAVTAASLNGAVITDGNGHALDLAGAVGNPAGTLEVDTIRPRALNAVESRPFQPGGTFTITFNYSETVIVSGGGTPAFALSNGGVAVRSAELSTPTSSVFTYTVQPDDDPQTLMIVGFDPAGTVAADRAGNLLDDASVSQAIAAAQGAVVDQVSVSVGTIDVYRFFDTKTGTHFYTQDPAERAVVLNTRPDLIPEGPNGVGLTAVDPASNDPNAVPVYRFFDRTYGTHFFTASSAERDTVIATRPDMVYEPASTFYEHATPQAGDTPVYRYFDNKYGTHFYTDDPKERASIQQTRPDLVSEGIGFYEPAHNPAS